MKVRFFLLLYIHCSGGSLLSQLHSGPRLTGSHIHMLVDSRCSRGKVILEGHAPAIKDSVPKVTHITPPNTQWPREPRRGQKMLTRVYP